MRQLLLWPESFQKRVVRFLGIEQLAVEQTYMQDIGLNP